MVDGVPDSIGNNPMAMRTLLKRIQQSPQEKMEAIQSMMDSLIKKATKFEEYDIQVDQAPQTLKSRSLAAQELTHKEGDVKLYACERLLKKMPVYSSDKF